MITELIKIVELLITCWKCFKTWCFCKWRLQESDRSDNTATSKNISSADLKVLLSVQSPRGQLLLRGTWNAPKPFGVKGQAHDWLGVGFGWAYSGPLGYIPQQQGTVLISSHQKRSRSRVCLEQREDDKRKDEDKEEGRCDCRVESTVWCWELSRAEVIILEAPADTQGSCGLHSSACWALSRNSLQHCSLCSPSVLLTPAFKKEGFLSVVNHIDVVILPYTTQTATHISRLSYYVLISSFYDVSLCTGGICGPNNSIRY